MIDLNTITTDNYEFTAYEATPDAAPIDINDATLQEGLDDLMDYLSEFSKKPLEVENITTKEDQVIITITGDSTYRLYADEK